MVVHPCTHTKNLKWVEFSCCSFYTQFVWVSMAEKHTPISTPTAATHKTQNNHQQRYFIKESRSLIIPFTISKINTTIITSLAGHPVGAEVKVILSGAGSELLRLCIWCAVFWTCIVIPCLIDSIKLRLHCLSAQSCWEGRADVLHLW